MNGAEPHQPDEEVFAFPASVQQRAFWFLHSLSPEVGTFNVPLRYEIEGRLHAGALHETLTRIFARHEVLRTHFEEEDGELLQVILPARSAELPVTDLVGLSEKDRQAELDRIAREEAEQPFDLSVAPLVRMRLLRLEEQRHVFCFAAHHTVFDGWSINLLIDEIGEIYTALLGGGEGPPPLELQYADYSIWQRDFLAGSEVAKQTAFWKRKLAGMTEPELTSDRPRAAVKTWRGSVESLPIPAATTEGIRALGAKHGFTRFHLLLAAFKLLLARYTGSDDIAVGTPASGRTNTDMDPVIGVFINPLILRTDLSGKPTFLDLCDRVRTTVVESLENQDVPFERIVDSLKADRDPGRNPLFQINFTYEGVFAKQAEFAGLKWSPLSAPGSGVIFDLHLFVVESAEGWKLNCEYSTDLYERATIQRMLGHLLAVLDQAVVNPQGATHEIELLSDTERKRIVSEWSGARAAKLEPRSVSERFDEIARRFADRCALVTGAGEVSYGELASWVAAAAGVLRNHGVVAGSRVACCFPASVEAVVGILAILRAGASYVPMDPADPATRREILLTESGVSHLLIGGSAPATGGWRGELVVLPGRADAAAMPELPCETVDLESAAYVMFTSGSTGRPKGVVVPQRAILRLVVDCDFAELGPDEVFLLAAPLSFDASVLEVFGPLLNGGCLVVPGPNPSLDDMANAISRHGVTTLWLTAGLFQAMVDERLDALRGLRQLLTGGDVLSKSHVAKAFHALPDTRMINGYGPTENTTFTTCHTIREKDLDRVSIPIGRPVRGTSVFILDEDAKPLPVGIPGILHAGGKGLALSYLGDEELTAQRFFDHPEFGRLYNTGDRCRWTDDGTIEFLGRIDNQVKLRGFRIELGEIESMLGSHPDVMQCKVAVRGSGASEKRLLAWYCSSSGIEASALTEWLSSRLPGHMVPETIMRISEMPLNANGKVAVDALPVPEFEGKEHWQAPQGDEELRLAGIWSDLLGIETPGRDEDFFEVGGNSLAGMRMFARIQREFGVSLALATLLRARTIRSLATELAGATDADGGRDQLAEVQPLGERPPLCAIHAGDGGILFYRQLAERLPKDRPFLAIESADLGRDDRIEVPAIEETAARYVEILRAARPSGPYLLAGYSYGGVVAFEMAKLLVEAGEKVPFVALFDTINPATEIRTYAFSERVATFWNAQSEVALGERIVRLAGRFKSGVETHLRVKAEVAAVRNLGDAAAAHTELRAIQLREAHEQAMDAYQPGVFLGTLHVFRASAANDKFEIPDDYGWGDRVEQLEMIDVPGEHLTMFEAGNVGPLAESFAAAIRDASKEDGNA